MGLSAGYLRGWVDDVVSTIANIVLSFPVLVLYVVIISVFGASGGNIILAVTFASAPGIMRIVRGIVLDLRNRDYVASAETRGRNRALHNVRGDPAERHFAFDRRCLPAPRLRDHHHRGARLSRPRLAAAAAGLGRHGQRIPLNGHLRAPT